MQADLSPLLEAPDPDFGSEEIPPEESSLQTSIRVCRVPHLRVLLGQFADGVAAERVQVPMKRGTEVTFQEGPGRCMAMRGP
eukprot:953881-Rhodomonas_salina.1